MVGLDMESPIELPFGTIEAKCSSMVIRDALCDETFYVNYNHEKDQIYAQRAKGGEIKEIYREGQHISDVNFVIFIVRAHTLFLFNKVYQQIEKNRVYGAIT